MSSLWSWADNGKENATMIRVKEYFKSFMSKWSNFECSKVAKSITTYKSILASHLGKCLSN